MSQPSPQKMNHYVLSKRLCFKIEKMLSKEVCNHISLFLYNGRYQEIGLYKAVSTEILEAEVAHMKLVAKMTGQTWTYKWMCRQW